MVMDQSVHELNQSGFVLHMAHFLQKEARRPGAQGDQKPEFPVQRKSCCCA